LNHPRMRGTLGAERPAPRSWRHALRLVRITSGNEVGRVPTVAACISVQNMSIVLLPGVTCSRPNKKYDGMTSVRGRMFSSGGREHDVQRCPPGLHHQGNDSVWRAIPVDSRNRRLKRQRRAILSLTPLHCYLRPLSPPFPISLRTGPCVQSALPRERRTCSRT
jgi:hypothetical protein